MKKSIPSMTLLSALLGATAVTAAPATKENPAELYGSDTMAEIMAFAISAINASADPDAISLTYRAVGSSYGQRQMEGGATNTGEATCTPNSSGTGNDGCQQISPMSRQMNSGICDDDSDTFGASTTGESDLAEGLAICDDKLVMTVDNNDVCGGDLGAGTTWQAKLKLLYTGCTTETGTACSAVARSTRCARSERSTLIADWDNYLSGCTTGACAGGIRAAYRRDDASGTTGVFLGFLGLSETQGLTSGRSTYRPTFGSCGSGTGSAPSETHPFCDGGQFEGFFNNPGTGAVGAGDPIRANCATEDDLCGRDGKAGVVRAIRSVANDVTNDQAFPAVQCTRGARAQITVDATSCAICPDGTVPVGGKCWFPYYNNAGTPNFNCMSDRTNTAFSPNCSSNTAAANYCDGRAPNFWTVSSTGVARFAATAMPEVAQYRQNMANLSTSFTGGAGGAFTSFICTERDATRNIGCLTGNTTCTTGFSGREQAVAAENDPINVALKLDGKSGYQPADAGFDTYPMGRKLWINAIGGFANVEEQCGNDLGNESSTYCHDQVELANWFRDPANAAAACISGGYLPIYSPGTTTATIQCLGANTAATCGSTVNSTWDSSSFASATACLAN
jgi:hypothetical protein